MINILNVKVKAVILLKMSPLTKGNTKITDGTN